jgi:hypothetical protein
MFIFFVKVKKHKLVNLLHLVVGLNPLSPNQHVFFVLNFPNLVIFVEKNDFFLKIQRKM